MMKNIYKKVLLCTVCSIACNTNIVAMHRVTKLVGHLVQPGSPEEYSIAHANALRAMNTIGALKKHTDAKKPIFSEHHSAALESLVKMSFADAYTENDLIEFFTHHMCDDDFRKSVYVHVGKILNDYQQGPISSNFITFLIVYSPESYDMFSQIKRLYSDKHSDRFVDLVTCIQGARSLMRDGRPLTRYDVSQSIRKFLDVTNECLELLTKASKKPKLPIQYAF